MQNCDFDEIREILRDVAIRLDQITKVLHQHARRHRMAEHDQRMERVGRHLAVLAKKAGRKRR